MTLVQNKYVMSAVQLKALVPFHPTFFLIWRLIEMYSLFPELHDHMFYDLSGFLLLTCSTPPNYHHH